MTRKASEFLPHFCIFAMEKEKPTDVESANPHEEKAPHPQQSPPPPHTPPQKPSRLFSFIDLSLRVCTLFFLVAGLVVLVVNQIHHITRNSNGAVSTSLHFLDLISYRYIFAAILISLAYIVLQIVFSLFRLITGLQRGKIILYFDFFGDKILTYLLATGAAAAFGASIDMKNESNYNSFLNRGNTAASLVFVAFIFSVASSIISSHSLPHHNF